jgi:hypothetical protein
VRTILPYEHKKFLIGSGTEGFFIFNGREIKRWDSPVQEKIKKAQINNGWFDGKYYYVGQLLTVFIFSIPGEH